MTYQQSRLDDLAFGRRPESASALRIGAVPAPPHQTQTAERARRRLLSRQAVAARGVCDPLRDAPGLGHGHGVDASTSTAREFARSAMNPLRLA